MKDQRGQRKRLLNERQQAELYERAKQYRFDTFEDVKHVIHMAYSQKMADHNLKKKKAAAEQERKEEQERAQQRKN